MDDDPIAAATRARRRQITMPLADVVVDVVTEAEAVEVVVESASRGEGGLVVTPNVDHLRLIAQGGWLGALYADADLVVADGMPLVWASRLMGDPLPERVAGSDLLELITGAAAAEGLSVYFLGGAPGTADAAAAHFSQRWADLKVAGTSCPPRGFERRRGGLDAVCDEVVGTSPAIVFVGLGAPKQEHVCVRLREAMPSAWCLGVGAAFDMAVGHVDRAPMWVRRIGAEWLYRFLQEPRRMGGRYLWHGVPFTLRLLVASRRVGRDRSGRDA